MSRRPTKRTSSSARAIARALTLGVLALGALAGVEAQQPADTAAETTTVSETTTVIAVEIPVTVVRKGAAVRDLAAGDFEVRVDGAPTPVIGFEAIDFAAAAAGGVQGQAPSEAASRNFLFFFDLALTSPQESQRGLEAARAMLASGLHPADRVAVGVYAETLGGRLVSGFTVDRLATQLALEVLDKIVGGSGKQTVEAVRTLVREAGDRAGEGLRQMAVEAPAYLRLQGGGVTDAQSLAGEAMEWLGGGGGGRAPDAIAETLGDMETTYQQEIRPAVVRQQSFRFLQTLGDLASALRDVRGQRFFVLFSAGLEEWVLEGSSQSSGASQLTDILGGLTRTGWQVHAVQTTTQQSMFGRGMGFLAAATGGSFYRNMQPARALGSMMEQSSAAYVLTVQPESLGAAGSYHAIEVDLVADRRSEVHHRAGFFTPSETGFDAQSYDALAVGSVVATYEDGGALAPRVFAVAWKPDAASGDGAATEARVPMVIEIGGAALAAMPAEGSRRLWVDAYRLVPPSGAQPLFVQPLALDPVQHAVALDPRGGVKVFAEVALPPGEHRLRVVVRDPAGLSRSVTTASVFVPDFARAEPQVLPPIYPDQGDRWLYVSHRAPESAAPAFPFQFEARKFMPQARATVAEGTLLPVFLAGIDLPDGGAALRLNLETAAGEPIADERLRIAGTSEREPNGLLRVMAQLDTGGLDPGGYRLRLSWSDAVRGVVKEAWQGFTVVAPEVAGAVAATDGP